MANYCPDCGTEITTDTDHCPDCGTQLTPPNPETDSTSNSLLNDFTPNQLYLLGSATLTAFAAFLPWLSVRVFGASVSVTGVEGDGVYTLIAAIVVFVLAAKHWTRITRITSGILGFGISGLALLYILGSEATPEMGLFLTLIGGVGILYFSYQEDTEAVE